MQEPPEITVGDQELFPEDADQEHYLTVMNTSWRASRTPSPAHSTQALMQVSTQSLLHCQALSPAHSTQALLQPGYPAFRQESPASARTSCGLVVGEGEGAPLTEGFNMREPSPMTEPIQEPCPVVKPPRLHITHKLKGFTRETTPPTETVSTSCKPSLSEAGEPNSIRETTPPLEAPGISTKPSSIDTDKPSNRSSLEVVVGEMDVPLQDVVPVADKVVVVACHSAKAASLARTCRWSGYKKLPDGCELTVGELHDMASRQQQQIETQQQLLVAREQRLKYLKQQDTRAHQVHQEAERLRRLRERVEAQEAKLRRLRALRGQVEATRMNTASLTTDLDAMRHLFSEKEKELVVAVGKVEELTHQLEELREGRSANNPNNQHHNELDKLRRELLYRNSVNREASARVAQQRETLAARRDEITKIDKRIAELQQRLHRKRLLNQQLASQITAATQAKQAQLKAVQQKSLRDGTSKENSIDDSHLEHLKIPSGEELGEFGPNKHDPKYQTLPYNTKFPMGNINKEQSWESEGSTPTSEYPPGSEQNIFGNSIGNNSSEEMGSNNNINSVNSSVVRTVHSMPTSVASRGLAHAPQLQVNASSAAQSVNPAMNPRVYGTNTSQINQRSQPLGSSGHGINQDSSSVLPPTSLSLSFNQKLNPGVTQSRNHHASAHLAQGVENIRAMDGSSIGSGELVATDDSGGDGHNKPALPPKPAVPSKPLPPPRQKGDPMLSSTESLNSLQQTPPHNKNHPGYRYASQNVIMSTYTQQSPGAENHEGTEDHNWPNNINNNNNINKRDSEGEKVHVSINRRIEMPPDFMFPEDETPPSDLLGQRVEEIENGLDSVDNLHVPSVPYSELEKLRIDVSKEEISNQDKINSNTLSVSNISNTPFDESRQPDGADAPTALLEGHTDGDAECINNNVNNSSTSNINTQVVRRIKKGNLKTKNSNRVLRRVSFDPLALLLDASLEGELELVRRTAMEVPNPSAANDEGITALHNAICAGHLDIVTFLVTFGCDVNAQDSDGWTPLHCAASCNNVAMVRFLVEHGACILATTLSDHETAAEKCEQDEEGYDGCSQYLYSVQEKLGIMNGGVVYSVYDYEAQATDELDMGYNDTITILRRGDEYEREWWWGQRIDKQGYVPRNLLGLYPRVKNPLRDS